MSEATTLPTESQRPPAKLCFPFSALLTRVLSCSIFRDQLCFLQCVIDLKFQLGNFMPQFGLWESEMNSFKSNFQLNLCKFVESRVQIPAPTEKVSPHPTWADVINKWKSSITMLHRNKALWLVRKVHGTWNNQYEHFISMFYSYATL